VQQQRTALHPIIGHRHLLDCGPALIGYFIPDAQQDSTAIPVAPLKLFRAGPVAF
jgi:hypothetical protein